MNTFTKWIGSRTSVVLHTIFFSVTISLIWFGYNTETILLILTTVVSLEAIYLSLFIQMTVNQNTESLEDVEEDLEDIVEDVGEISEDIDEIQQEMDEHDKEENLLNNEGVTDVEKLDSIDRTLRKLLVEIETLKVEIKK